MTAIANSVADSLAEHFLGVLPVRPSDDQSPDYATAFRQWSNLLGTQHVQIDDATRDDYSRTTLPVGTRPAGVVRPQTTAEVSEVVRTARQCRVPLHAISRGKNWGYGDACAPYDGYVIVDLRRMNRIREVNVELGYAVIEPGVSQGQMYEYLRDNNLPLLLDVTGAGPDASIVGNILQRGFGHTPYGDRFRHTSGFEVVLPDGRVINTGFGQFENAQASRVFPWGIGPWLDGLFTQSNYGIVTSACIWLMPRPEVIEGFALQVGSDHELEPLISALRELRMSGTIRSTVHVANDIRVLSSHMQFPWHQCPVRPLSAELRQELRDEYGIGAWNVLGGLYGTELEVRAQRRSIRKKLGRVSRLRFFRRRKIELASTLAARLPPSRFKKRIQRTITCVAPAFDLLEGVPVKNHLKGAFWRSRDEANSNADIRGAGLIWFSPVVPMIGGAIREFVATTEAILLKNRFEPLITLSAVTDRSMCCVTSINYVKTSADEAERAGICLQELRLHFTRLGYFSYRSSSVE